MVPRTLLLRQFQRIQMRDGRYGAGERPKLRCRRPSRVLRGTVTLLLCGAVCSQGVRVTPAVHADTRAWPTALEHTWMPIPTPLAGATSMLPAIAFFVVHVVRSPHHREFTASQCAKLTAPLYSESGD
jgi:hypothetical protein